MYESNRVVIIRLMSVVHCGALWCTVVHCGALWCTVVYLKESRVKIAPVLETLLIICDNALTRPTNLSIRHFYSSTTTSAQRVITTSRSHFCGWHVNW